MLKPRLSKVVELRQEVKGVEEVVALVEQALATLHAARQRNAALVRTGKKRSRKTPTYAYEKAGRSLRSAEKAAQRVKALLAQKAAARRATLLLAIRTRK